MNKGLEYFKSVYKDVPAWVQIMNDYDSTMLDAYTELRGQAFKTNYLQDYEKDELIAAVNAGRLYDRSMVLHTQAGMNKGSKLVDLIEYFFVSYVYKGLDALVMSLKAVQFYLKAKHNKEVEIGEYTSLLEVVNTLISWVDGDEEAFLVNLKTKLINASNQTEVKAILMEGNSVTKARKQLCMVGMYLTELDGQGAKAQIEAARQLGVSEAELADLGYVIILTAGIPTWFELSDHLEKKEG